MAGADEDKEVVAGADAPAEVAADDIVVGDDKPRPLQRPVIVDPAVSLRKLQVDLDAWHARPATWWFEHRGALLLRVDGLVVDIGFTVPGTFPTGPPGAARGAVMPIAIRLNYTNYDLEAPSLTFIDPFTGEPTVPGAPATEHVGGQEKNILLTHPVTKLPFICQPGTAEYHTHHQHNDGSWLFHHRDLGAGRVAVVVERVWEAMTRGLSFNMGIANIQVLALEARRDLSHRLPPPADEPSATEAPRPASPSNDQGPGA